MRMSERAARVILCAVMLAVTLVCTVSAQPRNRVDNRGREFRVAFLQTNGADDAPQFALVIAAEKPTSGTLTYVRSGRTVPIPTLQPNVPIRLQLDTNQLLLPNPARIPISSFSVYLRFNEEVVMYGVNTQRWSSDAFLALPQEVLGTEHIILSYPNTIDPNPAAAFSRSSDFPSQFAILATEDNTAIRITPAARISSRPDTAPYDIVLNAGEVYFAQAFGRAGTDLTGTRISSSRRVIVYGSHQRANVPWDEAVGRDHLIEQLPPIDRWAHRAIVTPHYQIPKTVADKNIVRVLAGADNTQIFVDSTFLTTINAQQHVEIELDRAKLITASGPILVAQYHHSTVDERFVSQPNDSVGDPFFMLVPAQEQFDSVYWFESFATKDFFYHFINVVIPTERVGSLLLDGFPVNVPFQRVDKTSYSYAQIPVSLGFHKISARAPFGLYMYGYGVYNSYGAPGALIFDSLFKDQKEPDLEWIDTCGGAAGYAIDDAITDFGVEAVRLLAGSVNVRLEVDPFTPGADSVHFRVPLIDPYQDGVAEMLVVDTAGLDRRYRFPVKGFTVSMTIGQTAPVELDTLASLSGGEFCRRITLRNYGQFPQRITGLRFNSPAPGLRTVGEFPIEIEPGGSREVTLCYQFVGDTAYTVELQVDNGCLKRPIALLPLVSGVDSLVPVLQPVFDPCDIDRRIKVIEAGVLNSGITSVSFLDSSNVQFSLSPSLPGKEIEIRLERRDPYQDMIYSIVVTDAVGNKAFISDTVGGFTLSVQTEAAEQVGARTRKPWIYPNLTYGEEICDTFYLRNYGLLTLTLQRPRVIGNIEYSIPPDQLPVVLQPGEVRPLLICIKPRGFGEQIDTLIIDFNCGTPQELVVLRTNVDPLVGQAVDRCGNALGFQVNGFVKQTFLQPPVPNPTGAGRASIFIGLTEPESVTLGLFDGLGNEVRRFLDRDAMPGGIITVDARLSELPAGLYYLRLRTETGALLTQKLVIDR